jgi:integrase
VVLDALKLRKRFYEMLDRAELRRITFHGLRHTTEIYAHYAPGPARWRDVRGEGVGGAAPTGPTPTLRGL